MNLTTNYNSIFYPLNSQALWNLIVFSNSFEIDHHQRTI